MKSAMEVSLYPLHAGDLGPSINRFVSVLKAGGCNVEMGPMSTLVTGESEVIFDSLRRAYEAVASEGGVVVIAKISNACPVQ